MSNNLIGENIRKYRMMAGYTQAELAEELSELEGKNVAASAIAGYENGQRVPKVEVRVQIAKILGVDPVALSGIELSEVDEKRLLCKLLLKYATDITLKKDGTVNLDLPVDFAGFQMEYKENKEKLNFLLSDITEDSLQQEIATKSTEDELNYWIEMYPVYDAVFLCNENIADCTINDIKKYRTMVSSEFQTEFYSFQDSYLTPMMNKEVVEKLRNKKGGSDA